MLWRPDLGPFPGKWEGSLARETPARGGCGRVCGCYERMFVVMFCLRLTTPPSLSAFLSCFLVFPGVFVACVGLFSCLGGLCVVLLCRCLGFSPGVAMAPVVGCLWVLLRGCFARVSWGFGGVGWGSFSSVMLFRFVGLWVVCVSRVCAVFFVGAGRSPASGDVAKRAVWVLKSGGESCLSW